MLRSFQVTNHRSLAEPQELWLTPGPITGGSRAGAVATPVTAIYGTAATGKTNLVDALAHMRAAVLNSVTGWDPYAGPIRAPHLGFPDRPSEFVANFVAEGCPYTYGFQLDNADVTAEWLHSHPHSRKRIVFERADDQIKIGPIFEAARYGITALVPLVRPNALLLSMPGQIYAEALVPAYRWFQTQLEVHRGQDDPQTIAHRLGSHLSRSPENAARLLTLLRSADLGITDLLLTENDPRYAGFLNDLDNEIAATAQEVDSCTASPSHAEALRREHGVTLTMLERELGNLRAARDALYSRMVARRGVGLGLVHEGTRATFDITDESTATLALLRLLPIMLDALDTGRVLVVDDIAAGLTVEAAGRLVQLFQNPETNSQGAQLIFTTDDRTLIGAGHSVRSEDDNLRHDEGPGEDRDEHSTGRIRAPVWQLWRTDHGTSELGRHRPIA